MSAITCSARSRLFFALLDVRALEPLHVALIEHGGHRPDRLELAAHVLELRRLEHARRPRRARNSPLRRCPSRRKTTSLRSASGTNSLIFGERAVGALPEADRAHLRQRSDRRRESFPDGKHAGDRRRGDRAEPDEQDAKFAARRRNLNW